MRNNLAFKATLAAVLGLAGYTQLAHLTSVPGLHFDEAWQGLFASRIAGEAGFWPTQAMNSYTSPVIHYILALVFRAFGTSLEAMRGFYAFLNLSTLALLCALLWRRGERPAAVWLALLWALLPLSVHNHRFYVEVTGFHGLCLALGLWGLELWRRRAALSFTLLCVTTLAATYAHVLYIAIFFSGIFMMGRLHPDELATRRARGLVAMTALLIAPLPVRMGIGLGKALPFALALGLMAVAAWALLSGRLPRLMGKLMAPLVVASIPFLVSFVFLLWNGIWPYAQATGDLEPWLSAPNAALFLYLLWRQARAREPAPPSWEAFVVTFLACSVLILKQVPRYYTVPMIFALIWCAQRLARLGSARLQAAIAAGFVALNLWAFEVPYLRNFEASGATTREFRLGPYHDNARDFRPFQKMFDWARSQGCLGDEPWVEDDRFKLPFEFLRLSRGRAGERPTSECPWRTADLFFSHIPGYDPALDGARNDANTPPPEPAPNVKFLAHFPEWGDLAVWIRR